MIRLAIWFNLKKLVLTQLTNLSNKIGCFRGAQVFIAQLGSRGILVTVSTSLGSSAQATRKLSHPDTDNRHFTRT